MNVIRAAGLTTVAAIAAVVTVLFRRERGRKLGESLSKT
jgi:hypothetical protein